MPFYKRDNRLIHHIHIPKCGGRSIKKMLVDSGWKEIPHEVPKHLRDQIENETNSVTTDHEHEVIWRYWNQSPEYRFAVVRNPYSKFNSKVKMEAEIQMGEIPKGAEFDLDVATVKSFLSSSNLNNGGFADNHFRKQVDFVSLDTIIYFFENGLERLESDLKERGIVDESVYITEVGASSFKVNIPWLSEEYAEVHAEFVKAYSEDFAAFDYKILSQ